MAGWGDLAGKVAQWFPGRIEKYKNERQDLINERELLFKKTFSASGSRRIEWIDARLRKLEELLVNKASD